MRKVMEIAIRAVKGYGADGCAVFAGGVTYYALLSLFPLALVALAVAGFIFSDPGDQDRLVENMLDAMPLDSSTAEDLGELVHSVVEARGTLGVIGFFGAAYSASALFGAIRTALNTVVKAEKKRPFFLGKAVDLLQVLIFAILLLLSVGVTVGITLAQQFSEELFGEEAATLTARLLTLAYAILPTAVSALAFFLIFTYVPARRLGVRHTVWGAIVAAVLFEILKVLFAQYVANFGNYNATYGTLGFVIILLVFINFSAQVMLLGAQVALASAELPAHGPERFTETRALERKFGPKLAKLPIIGRRWANQEPDPPGQTPLAPEVALVPADGPQDRLPGEPRRAGGFPGLLLVVVGVIMGLAVTVRRR